jgi:alkylation response protein AidB-like acyl-CoA dehydrogenase
VDLQLTEEQRWLRESVDELLAREPAQRLWASLVEFGALQIGDDDGLGAVELALVARSVGAHLAAVPYAESAAVGYVADAEGAPVTAGFAEPGRGFEPADPAATLADGRVTGAKSGVAYADTSELIAVPASSADGVALALVPAAAAEIAPEPTLDPTLRPALVRLDGAPVDSVVEDVAAVETVAAVGGVLVSAEAVGAAAAVLELARDYASQRRQFGHPIGSFQAVRHLLADMYVKVESSWSSVLYAAAALDEREPDSLRTASIAKAYSARATRDVAHSALQVFGGIAFTAEHDAHRFLRRIVARAGHFGSAADHERSVGNSLAHELEVLT